MPGLPEFHTFPDRSLTAFQLTQSDPVHAVDVVEFIKHHLTKVQNENGGPDQFRIDWVENVDKHVLQDFAKLGVF